MPLTILGETQSPQI